MFLKNYTSNVPVSQTIFRIEEVLIKCGVSGITKEYAPDATVNAITFNIKFGEDSRNLTVRMPADKSAALDALWLDYVDGDKLNADGESIHWNSRKRKTKADFAQQAERTAWKIVQDWIEVQMSMILMKQAETLQVFLPYAWDGSQTYYQRLKESGYKMLSEKT